MTVTAEGLRIELMETEKGMFSTPAAARSPASGEDVLKLLADQLKQLPNKLLIEGHTDAKPYSSPTGYTNWELFADAPIPRAGSSWNAGFNRSRWPGPRVCRPAAAETGRPARSLQTGRAAASSSSSTPFRRVASHPPRVNRRDPGLAGQAPAAAPHAAGAVQGASPVTKPAPGA